MLFHCWGGGPRTLTGFQNYWRGKGCGGFETSGMEEESRTKKWTLVWEVHVYRKSFPKFKLLSGGKECNSLVCTQLHHLNTNLATSVSQEVAEWRVHWPDRAKCLCAIKNTVRLSIPCIYSSATISCSWSDCKTWHSSPIAFIFILFCNYPSSQNPAQEKPVLVSHSDRSGLSTNFQKVQVFFLTCI